MSISRYATATLDFTAKDRNRFPTSNWGRLMFKVSDTIRNTRTQDGGVILDIGRGQIFSLNVVGSEILELAERGLDESSIVDKISQAHAANADDVRKDVHDFLNELRKHAILK
jgi:hypothetical protein